MLLRCSAEARWLVINHYNIRRVIDIYGTPQDRDLGAVSSDVQRIVDAHRKSFRAERSSPYEGR